MRSKISFKWSAVILGAAGIVFSAIVIFLVKDLHANTISYVSNPVLQDPQLARAGLPVRLIIPKINIDAAIEYVGLTPQGAMGVPEGPTSTAWFDLGPRPGEDGSAVIAGHEGWKEGIQAVFDNLYELQKGDKLYVKNEQGTTTAFIVRAVHTYGENEVVSDVFSSSDGKAHLNLITCEGIWNETTKSYSGRLVVFADKEAE